MSHNTTGQWCVDSGGVLVGPFDGKHPAAAFAARMRRQGVRCKVRLLHRPANALQWASLHAPIKETQR